MKTLITVLFLIVAPLTKTTTVYICDSKDAKVYHSSKTCKGIERCTHEIKEVTLDDATKVYGRRACKICY